MVQRGWGGEGWVVGTPPLTVFVIFAMLPYLENILPFIDSLSCDLQDKVNIIGFDAAEGP